MTIAPYTTVFLQVADRLHRASLWLCMGLLAVLFATQLAVVVLRYLFAVGFVELQDFVLYCFAWLSIFGLPVALRLDKHVRVDIFRRTGDTRMARRIDQIAFVALVLPLCVATLYYAAPLVSYSWSIKEGARETGGLGGYFLIMTGLPVVCVLLMVQIVALLLDGTLIHGKESD